MGCINVVVLHATLCPLSPQMFVSTMAIHIVCVALRLYGFVNIYVYVYENLVCNASFHLFVISYAQPWFNTNMGCMCAGFVHISCILLRSINAHIDESLSRTFASCHTLNNTFFHKTIAELLVMVGFGPRIPRNGKNCIIPTLSFLVLFVCASFNVFSSLIGIHLLPMLGTISQPLEMFPS